MAQSDSPIPFVRPWLSGREHQYLDQALASGRLGGDGQFSRRCSENLTRLTGARRALVTGSATHALELACLILRLQPGDEAIMPSFTFASTANAVALRGATPVFVDIEPDSLNIDCSKAEAAITARTRLLLPIHYAGVACDTDAIVTIANSHGLSIIEDAAHAIGAGRNGRALGSFGNLAAFSFHQTKNLSAGEAGALLINDASLLETAEIAWDKGTSRQAFGRGEINHYSWIDLGSSWQASELVCAVLLAQLEELDRINALRLSIWQRYHQAFAGLERRGRLRRPMIPAGCEHNAHIYYLLTDSRADRDQAIAGLQARGISANFHYVPLHSSPAGRRFGRTASTVEITDRVAGSLLRLPIFAGINDNQCARVIAAVHEVFA